MAFVPASGDVTGVTDTAAINAALATGDATIDGNYYLLAGTDGKAIKTAQNKSVAGLSAVSKAVLYLVGTQEATFTGIAIAQSGNGDAKGVSLSNMIIYGGRNGLQSTLISFTAASKTIAISSGYLKYRGFGAGDTITITGSASNNGNYTIASITDTTVVVNESLVNESAGANVRIFKSTANGITNSGACISFTSHNDYGSNNISLTDMELYDGPTQQGQFNSVVGITCTRVKTGYTLQVYPTQAAHGFDFDAVAYDKPCTTVTLTTCTFDAYGQDAMKMENTNTVSATGCTLNGYWALTQDNDIPYSSLSGISISNSQFNSWLSLGYLKRRHTPAGSTSSSTPAANLTLGQNTIGSGIACTASAGVFSAGDVNKGFSAKESGITGFAIITGFTSSTLVTIQIVNDFFDTSVATGTWTLAATDNSGAGDITLSGNTFANDDALIMGTSNNYTDYGTITLNNNRFSGRNSISVPNGVYPVYSGTNIGIDQQNRMVLWVRTDANIKYQNVSGTSGGMVSRAKSMGCTTSTTALTTAQAQANNRFNWTDFRQIYVNGTYINSSFSFSGNGNGNTNLRFSIEAETPRKVILDGTGSSGSFFSYTGTNTQLVTLRGLYLTNFSGGTSTRGITVNAATAVARIENCYAFNNSCTSNGGSAIRVQNAQSATIIFCVFDTNIGVTAGNGAAVLCDVVGCTVVGNIFKNNSVAGASAGVLRMNGGAAGTSYVGGNIFANNSAATTSCGLSISSSTAGATFHVYNNTFYGNTAPTTPQDISIFVNNATATCNCYNNIAYSSGQTNNIAKSGTGVFNYGFNCSPTAVSATGGTNTNSGGGITSDPAFTSLTYFTISRTSPCYQTGKNPPSDVQAAIVDINNNPFSQPFSMGAYEINAMRQIATTRSAASSRSAATSRTAAESRINNASNT